MGTASGANTNGFGDVAVGNKTNRGGVVRGINAGNKANGVSDAVGVGADDTTNGGVGRDAASFVPKTNSSIAARVICVSWCSCQSSHAERGESQIIPQFTNAEKFKQN
jgi:hypothetical protein